MVSHWWWWRGAGWGCGKEGLGQLLDTKFSDQVPQAWILAGEGLLWSSHTVSGLSWRGIMNVISILHTMRSKVYRNYPTHTHTTALAFFPISSGSEADSLFPHSIFMAKNRKEVDHETW